MKTQIDKSKNISSKETSRRFFLFALSFLIGVIASVVGDGYEGLIFLSFAVPFFPQGLIAFLVQNFNDPPAWSESVGWAIYISLALIGVSAKSRYIFITIYIIFIVLLIMNVKGCQELQRTVQ